MRKRQLSSTEDPFATRWLYNFDPNRKSQKVQTDEIDREIDKILDEARFKSAVLVAKAEIIDDLKRALEANRG